MKTYIFRHRNSKVVIVVSADNEEDAMFEVAYLVEARMIDGLILESVQEECLEKEEEYEEV